MVIWIIGLAGAGKTSIAKALYQQMKQNAPATIMVDGDMIREVMGEDLGHTLEDRRKNGWRICRLCRYLDSQNVNVICATLSQFHEQQQWNRDTYSSYFEVLLDVPMETLIARDQKGLYSGARSGKIKDVVGVDMPFPLPLNPDLVIKNNEPLSDFSAIAGTILAKVHGRGLV